LVMAHFGTKFWPPAVPPAILEEKRYVS
jgi:hypothetical protein